ncbi:MAG: cytochrome c3 family protein [Thermodesulfovibrio sp.]|uniref:cytochrome c3 family protein n=1 Tax=unclassified Thermodesulfovibrio TaxID=2645936 RepID=UPI00083B0BB1|nr:MULTISPECIES: cytochrome c3 family protein [unclassified Thermodesulfovibrio]MDI1471255.1 cytochrome c3 family protein [Thermodesulfovibrio sp. 1176]MDI6714740.1 cytochrome c3 family protein [Thermodesulfovibrio sp.]ODA43487.1 class III cytochrome C family protein [Thermodesulfovibrio sp. N1]
MKSKKGLMVLIVACFLFAISFVYAQPQDVYKLHWEGAKLPPTEFTHKKHAEDYKIDCKVCHHKDPNPAEKVAKCISCHDIAEAKNGAPKAETAYHKNCIDCHKKENEGGKAAPTKCNECHKKG